MEDYLPYIVSVVCALISGFTSYAVARRQSKEDVKKLEKTYELDLENEKAVVVVLPFADIGNSKAPISKNLCWVQDFKGNILQKIFALIKY